MAFKLTANLEIKTTNLDAVVSRIKTKFNSISANVNITASLDPSFTRAENEIKSLEAMVNTNKNWNISLKVATPTATQTKSIDRLRAELTAIEPVLLRMNSRPYSLNINFGGLNNTAAVRETARALNSLDRSLGRFNGARNVTLNFTGNIRTLIPQLHNLNSVLGSKIRHLREFQGAATSAGNALLGFGRRSNNTIARLNQAATATRQMGQAAQEATNFWYEFGKSGGLAVKRFGAFTIATSVVFGLVNAIGEAFRESIEFEKQLAKIAQVSNATVGGVKGISDEVGGLAVKYGISSQELLKITQIFAQAGKRGYELQAALEAIAKSDLTPTFVNMENTSEGLIAAMGQFGIKASEFERVLGSINAISADFAVESDDLVTAIRIFGGVFANASQQTKPGINKLQEMLALFSSIRDTTRESAESISTGLRTIVTRIQRPRTINFLKDYGINLQDEKGEFVGMFEAVQRLNAGMQNLTTTSEDFAKISEEIGGYRQMNKTIPLVREYAKALQMLQVAQRGENSLDAQVGVQLQTLSRRLTQVAEDFKRIVREITTTDTFKKMADMVFYAANAFLRLADSIKPILPMLATLVTIRGGMAAHQFISGAISQLKGSNTATGAGLNNVAAGGITGLNGIGTGLRNWGAGIRGVWQQAGFFQQPPPTTNRLVANTSLNYSQQLAGRLFYRPDEAAAVTPRLQSILSPVVRNLANTFGVGTREFNQAMNAVEDELYRYRNQLRQSNSAFALGYTGLPPGTRGVFDTSINDLTTVGTASGLNSRRFPLIRAAGVVGRGLANNAAVMTMTGMGIEAAGGGNATTNVIGRTISGIGMGGMAGGVPGVIIGGLIGAATSIVDALGPDKIRKANEEISKELEKIGEKFAEFDKLDINKPEFNAATRDLATSISNISDMISRSGKGGAGGAIDFLSNYPGESFRTGTKNLVNNPLVRILSLGTMEPTRALINLGLDDVDQRQQTKKYNLDIRNKANEILRSGVTKESLKAVEAFKQIVAKEGEIFTSQGELTEKGRLLQEAGKYDFEAFAKAGQYGSRDTSKNIAAIEADIINGKTSIDEQKRRGIMVLQSEQQMGKIEGGLKNLSFAFDNFKLSMEELGDVIKNTTEKNSALAKSTDEYFQRYMEGPSSTKLISRQVINPFKNPGAYEPEYLLSVMDKMNIGYKTRTSGSSRSDISNIIYFGRTIEKLLPQIIEQSTGVNIGNIALEKSLHSMAFGIGGENKGLFGNAPKNIRDNIQAVFDSIFQKEGKANEWKQGVDPRKYVQEILQNTLKDSLEATANTFDLLNTDLERIVEIVSRQLQIQQKIRQESIDQLKERQGYQKRLSNLFKEETLPQQYQRLLEEGSARAAIIGVGPINNMIPDLFGPEGLLSRRNIKEKELTNARESGAGRNEIQRLANELVSLQNPINKWVETAILLKDVEQKLLNVEQQALLEQKKREVGRDLSRQLLNMSASDRMNLIKGGLQAVALKTNPEGGIANNRILAGQTLDFLDLVKKLPGANQDTIRKLEAQIYSEIVKRQTAGTTPTGEATQELLMGGTVPGETPQEKKIADLFKAITGEAQIFVDVLNRINFTQKDIADKMAITEFTQSQQNIKIATMQVASAKINVNSIEEAGGETETGIAGSVFNNDIFPKKKMAKGGRLGGSGAIPIIAHGGELIIPKNKVDQGLGGVINFAKSQGLVFDRGGIIPEDIEVENSTLNELIPYLNNKYKLNLKFDDNIDKAKMLHGTLRRGDLFHNLRRLLSANDMPYNFDDNEQIIRISNKRKNFIPISNDILNPVQNISNINMDDLVIKSKKNKNVKNNFREAILQPDEEKKLNDILFNNRGIRNNTVMSSYTAGNITPEMLELRRQNEEKRRIRDNEFNSPLITYRPEYYNRRYGEGSARGFDPLKDRIPRYIDGTPNITRTGIAQVHQGEAIIPARANPNNPNNGINAIQARSNIDEALIKAANALAGINIPEKITLEISQINHVVTFNGNDVLCEQVAQRVAERANEMIQRQIASVISPINGEVLVG